MERFEKRPSLCFGPRATSLSPPFCPPLSIHRTADGISPTSLSLKRRALGSSSSWMEVGLSHKKRASGGVLMIGERTSITSPARGSLA